VKVINLPAAHREFAKAVAHIRKERPRRAVAFVQEIDRVSALLAENPYLGTPYDDDVRGYVLDRFPYTVYYVIRPDHILIAAISHQSRRPGHWHKRLTH
jgi:toxin ParE1/3/4